MVVLSEVADVQVEGVWEEAQLQTTLRCQLGGTHREGEGNQDHEGR